MSYIQLYVYRVPHVKREEFLDIMRKVLEIYRKSSMYNLSNW